jgi:GNAT superfamily N-acetyltransferase
MLVRMAEPADAHAVAAVHVRSWQVGYRGLLPDDYLDGLRPPDRAKHYSLGSDDPAMPRTIVAVEERVICGFATTGPARDEDVRGQAELGALYVDPPHWGRGVGRALIAEARGQLVRDGYAVAVLWVLVGNERAERFYRADGWRPDGTRRLAEVWGATVDERRLRRYLA